MLRTIALGVTPDRVYMAGEGHTVLHGALQSPRHTSIRSDPQTFSCCINPTRERESETK